MSILSVQEYAKFRYRGSGFKYYKAFVDLPDQRRMLRQHLKTATDALKYSIIVAHRYRRFCRFVNLAVEEAKENAGDNTGSSADVVPGDVLQHNDSEREEIGNG